MPPRSVEAAGREKKDLNLSFTSLEYLSCRMKGFIWDSWQRSGREREGKCARMITSTSSSLSDLNSVQTLMPLTVRVKGAKRIHESATWEDAVRRTSPSGSWFAAMYKKTFQRQIKTVCADKLDNLESIHSWMSLVDVTSGELSPKMCPPSSVFPVF